jgi:dipeptidyl aminopeptidase/acylaminoacyl peptidase
MRLGRATAWSAFFWVGIPVAGWADSTVSPVSPADAPLEAVLSQLERVRWPQLTAISPDGRWIAWTTDDGDIELAPVAAPLTGMRRITACTERPKDNATAAIEDGMAWSPDSRQLAFFSNCGADHQHAIYLADPHAPTGAAPRRLATLHGSTEAPLWSANGRQIAFLYSRDRDPSAGRVEWSAGKALSGVIGEEPSPAQTLASVDVKSGALTILSPGLHVFEFDWAPDSSRVVYTAAPAPGENNWWVAKMYVQTLAEGAHPVDAERAAAAPRVLVDPADGGSAVRTQQLALPRWSPDGKRIAFISGLMSDRGLTGGDIYLVPVAGGQPRDITPERKASPAAISWRDPNVLEVAENVGGESRLFEYDVNRQRESGRRELRLQATLQPAAPRMSFSMSRDGRVALILSSFTQPPEVWAGTLPDLQQITHYNDGLRPLWGRSESVTWRSEGFDVQGWLLYPHDFQPDKRYPMIVYVHGGPAYISTPAWPTAGYGAAPFSALGYFVFLPNPRGSFGQGEAFTRANRKDFGYGDLRDILAGVDAVSSRFPVDSQHVGLTGWSYGGYMSMFAVTQTNRFYAAVAGAGVSDWLSYYGESFIREWMPIYFGASVYDDPAVYAKSSPITFIGNARTPTLLVGGSADLGAPVQQMMEFWNGLRYRNVDTRLVVYPDEGHHFAQHDHRRDVLAQAWRWFQKSMPAQ